MVSLLHQLDQRVKHGQVSQDQARIGFGQPAIINFLRLCRLGGANRKLAPLSAGLQGFISQSEWELLPLLWNSEILQARIKNLAKKPTWALDDIINWLGST